MPSRNCVTCGALFAAQPSAKRRFCTHHCYAVYRKTLIGEKHPQWQGGGSAVLRCEHCGTTRKVWPSKLTNARFCSRKCWKAAGGAGQPGASHPHWKGGRTLSSNGHVLVRQPEHHRAHRSGYVYEHILIAERALGRPLLAPAVVHHANGIKADNRNSNLVVCQDNAYHFNLHLRLRTLRAGGDPWTEKVCGRCKAVLPHAAFFRSSLHSDGVRPVCRACTLASRRKVAA